MDNTSRAKKDCQTPQDGVTYTVDHSPAPTSEGAGRKSVLGRDGKVALGAPVSIPKSVSNVSGLFITPPSENQSTSNRNPTSRNCQELFCDNSQRAIAGAFILENQSITDRLQLLIEEKAGGSKSGFATLVGAVPSNITDWLKGFTPSGKHLLGIKKLGVSIDWLLTGEGGKYISTYQAPQVAENSNTYQIGREEVTPKTPAEKAAVEKLLKVWRTATPAKRDMIGAQLDMVINLTEMEAERKDVA